MIEIIILEDEAIAARRLQRISEKIGLRVVETFESTIAFREFILQHEEPDLYLMDIHLSDRNVFEYLKTAKLSSPIIFTTAFDQYAIDAFRLNSVDYLLKPIQETELLSAIERFKMQYQQNIRLDKKLLESLFRGEKTYRNRIKIEIGDEIKIVDLKDVTHFYSANKSTFLHCNNGRSYPIEQSLNDLITELAPNQFYQLSRSAVVQINAIEKIHKYSGNRFFVQVKNHSGEKIIVSRERVKGFKEWLGK